MFPGRLKGSAILHMLTEGNLPRWFHHLIPEGKFPDYVAKSSRLMREKSSSDKVGS